MMRDTVTQHMYWYNGLVLWRHDTLFCHKNAAADIVGLMPVRTDQTIACADGSFSKVPLAFVLSQLYSPPIATTHEQQVRHKQWLQTCDHK